MLLKGKEVILWLVHSKSSRNLLASIARPYLKTSILRTFILLLRVVLVLLALLLLFQLVFKTLYQRMLLLLFKSCLDLLKRLQEILALRLFILLLCSFFLLFQMCFIPLIRVTFRCMRFSLGKITLRNLCTGLVGMVR